MIACIYLAAVGAYPNVVECLAAPQSYICQIVVECLAARTLPQQERTFESVSGSVYLSLYYTPTIACRVVAERLPAFASSAAALFSLSATAHFRPLLTFASSK